MEYFKWMLLAACLVFGFINTGHCKPAATDSTDTLDYADDDYSYDSYDDTKSEPEDGGTPIESNAISSDPPYFENSEINVKANFGEDVTLNCDVRNFQLKNVVMWSKQQNIIVNGLTSLHKHIEALKNNSIRILNVQESDAGDYYCSVLPELIRLHINLSIGGKLAIYSDGRVVTEKTVTVRQGESRTLECKTFPSDNSTIKWSLNGERADKFDVKVDGGKLIIDYFDAQHAGIYQCLGDNGSSDPLHGSVTIDVHYAPIVSTHRHHVNTENGGKAELYCDYKAVPIAVAQWKRKGQYLEMFSEKYSMKSMVHRGKNRTVLTVKDVAETDLGEYECEAKNAIGSNEVKIHLIYEPEKAQFEDMKIEGRKVTLFWLVRSVQPLSEAIMEYRLNSRKTWSSESIISTSKHPEHTGVWKLRHVIELTPGTWQAQVRTKNTIAWSGFSLPHTFKVDESNEEEEMDNSIPQDMVLAAGIGSNVIMKPEERSSSNRLTLIPSFVICLSLLTLCKNIVPFVLNL